jgi:hypothetical protein
MISFDELNNFIELKNIIVNVGSVTAVGHSSVSGYGESVYYVIQLYLCNVTTPVILNYDTEEECLSDYDKLRSVLIPQKCEA